VLIGGVTWETRYTYRHRSGNDSTMQVQWMTHEIGNTALRYEYAYDTIGQIAWWQDPVHNARHTYTYDAQNQLTRETIVGGALNHTFDYVYDTYGNIRSRVHRNGNTTRTITLSYDNAQWRDLLTQINLNGAITNIVYDGNTGNPLSWHSGTNFTWTRGRQLQRVQRSGLDATFTYDHEGIRTGKRVNRNGVVTDHTFYTQNGRIVGEVRRNASGAITDRLEFIYDEAGRPVQLIHNNVVYNYVLNLQGDVQQIRRANDGVVVATYLYNAWGDLIASSGTMAEINPLRYRGYYQCLSSGFYYLQSRYYDPVVGRFLNADSFLSTGQGFLGHNAFAYCLNNPVNLVDPSGHAGVCIHAALAMRHAINVRVTNTGGAGNTAGWRGSAAQLTAARGVARAWVRARQQERYNTDVGVALEAFNETGIAWYRGAQIRPAPTGAGGAALFGRIWLPRGTNQPWVVTHEWGHLVDERYRGTAWYVVTVGMPSVGSVVWDGVRQWFGFPRVHHTRPYEQRAERFADQYSALPSWRRTGDDWTWDWGINFR